MRGGENVYPAEIEYFLHTHPKIQDAQVKIHISLKGKIFAGFFFLSQVVVNVTVSKLCN